MWQAPELVVALHEVELGTRFPVAVVEPSTDLLGRRAFAFVRERRVAEETDVYERLVGGAARSRAGDQFLSR